MVRLTIHTLMIGVVTHTMCTRAARVALQIVWNTTLCFVRFRVVLRVDRSAQPSNVIITWNVIGTTTTMCTMMYGVFDTSLFGSIRTTLVLVATTPVQ